MTPQSENQRLFFIGGEWLYYKFYTGPKTADNLLAEVIGPLAAEAVQNGIVDKWFFIRYGDPKLHVRVRFHIALPDRIGELIRRLHQAVKPLVDEDLIANVQIDTYQREIERYGAATMELAETLFFHDSVMQVRALEVIRGDQGEQLRWLFGLRAIDLFLDDFGLALAQKQQLLLRMKEDFQREFGGGKRLKVMLDGKFRREKAAIQKLFAAPESIGEAWTVVSRLMEERTAANRPAVEELRRRLNGQTPALEQNDLLTSYIHMMVNRLFRTRQRLHELVLYDFLHRHYTSLLARQKYNT